MTPGSSPPPPGEPCAAPVFIIGSPRSGTTALATALGLHPAFWVSKESYFLHQLLGDARASQVWQDNLDRVTPSWLRHEGVTREEFLAHIGSGFNALYSSRAGGRRWIDHTPRYTTMAAELADLFPGASFVHVLRDGRQVVRSMANFDRVFTDAQKETATHEIPAWTSDVVEAARTWARWTDAALDLRADRPDRVMIVANAGLATDPAAELDRVWAFLGVEPHAPCAAHLDEQRVNTSFRDVDVAAAGWATFPAELRPVFVEEAGATMVRAGLASGAELEEWARGG